MQPILDVLQLTEGFDQVWSSLADTARLKVRRHDAESEAVPSAPDSCGLVVALAGAEGSARDVVQRLREGGARRVAVVGAEADHRLVVSTLKRGADEFFLLPGDLGILRSWVQDQADAARLSARARASEQVGGDVCDFSTIIGESPGLRAALDRAARVVARSGTTVLITGETGTGKEVLARAIHANSPRRAQPFLEINCAALPAHLLEAELFGYERGAFTDAKVAKPGLFEAASGGTVLLDEIGDLGLELQGKLLRVLETRSTRRLGSVREQRVDVRILAATHVDLQEATRTGRFRQDLYYRLGVVPIHLPPLRDRGHDSLLLAAHFLERLSSDHGLPRPAFSEEVKRAILASPWPGNVRELRNAIERALVLGEGEVRVEDLFLSGAPEPMAGTAGLVLPAPLHEVEAAVARETLRICGGNKSEAARVLGISRRHLYVLLERGLGTYQIGSARSHAGADAGDEAG